MFGKDKYLCELGFVPNDVKLQEMNSNKLASLGGRLALCFIKSTIRLG